MKCVIEKVDQPCDAGREMKIRLRTDLRRAMKDGSPAETMLIRALIAALDNAEAPPIQVDQKMTDQHRFSDRSAETERLRLSAVQVRAILTTEAREREAAAAEMVRLNRPDRADALRTEALIARRYME